ncbi:MAG TPA: aspartyl protease family protein [Acidimicrobiales bacterium]|nr:aspartyl protease family protein [Acidimicrobiales bacterium]
MRSAALSGVALLLVLSGISAGATSPSRTSSSAATADPAWSARLATGTQRRTGTCHTATSLGSGATPPRAPLDLERIGAGVAALVGVCVHGSGPFEFIVDSGSSVSVVDPGIASRFGLRPVTGPVRAAGIGCPVTIRFTTISNWSIGPLPLGAQTVAIHSIPTILPGVAPAGIIASDVLARFGAVRLDYHTGTLSFEGREGPVFESASGGPRSNGVSSAGAAPSSLTSGAEVTASGRVAAADGRAIFYAPVRVGTGPARTFLVDTGAEITLVSPAVVSSSHLAGSGSHVRLLGIGCPVDLAEVESGPWAIGSARQPPQLFGVLSNAASLGIDGDLGSDTFSRYGAVVIDYRSATLILAR